MSSLQLTDFRVFPRHVGIWEGDWTVLDANCQVVQRFAGRLTQQIVDNQWVQTNEHTYTDGRQDVQRFIGTIVSAGQLQIESPDPPFNQFKALAEEQGDRLILFKVWNKQSGVLQAIELINLMSDTTRIRTTQSYTPEGTLKGVMVITEQKIADG